MGDDRRVTLSSTSIIKGITPKVKQYLNKYKNSEHIEFTKELFYYDLETKLVYCDSGFSEMFEEYEKDYYCFEATAETIVDITQHLKDLEDEEWKIHKIRENNFILKYTEEKFKKVYQRLTEVGYQIMYYPWRVVMTATGASSSTPRILHAANLDLKCDVCQKKPFYPLNRRLNPSLLLLKIDPFTPFSPTSIIIDVGKTFRETAMSQYFKHNVRDITSVIYTHEHMDALGGSDDLRELQFDRPMKLISSQTVKDHIQRIYPYFFNLPDPKLFSLKIDYQVVSEYVEFQVDSLIFQAIPVYHGSSCVCFGYAIYDSADPSSQMIYLSDFRCRAADPSNLLMEEIEKFTLFIDPDRALSILRSKPISSMVLDCLTNIPGRSYPSHANYVETVHLIQSFNKIGIFPASVYLTGMCCAIDFRTISKDLFDQFGGFAHPGFDGKNFPFGSSPIPLICSPVPTL